MTLPLAGIRVVDFTHVVSGPLCTRNLALLGADVIKVESPGGGDITRHAGPSVRSGAVPPAFVVFNVSKKSIGIDLRKPQGIVLAKKLIARADIVVENFRPGVMDKLGLGHDQLRTNQPNLIYCSVSGFGQTGSKRALPAFDNIIQAISGMMSVSGLESDGPSQTAFMAADGFSGFLATQAILAALVRRERTGEGDRIDVSMLEAALTLMLVPVGVALVTGERHVRTGNRAFNVGPGADVFPTADGHIALAAFTDVHFAKLWNLIDRPDLAELKEYSTAAGRAANFDQVQEHIRTGLSKKSALDWEYALEEAAIPASAVRKISEVLREPVLKERNFIRSVQSATGGAQVSTLGTGYTFEGSENVEFGAPPALGEHSNEILNALGIDEVGIAELRSLGVVV